MTHISPLVKMFGCVPLELCVSFVSCYRGSSSGQPSLSDVHMVTFHPLWPVTTVTAMHKTSTLQEKRGSCHHGCFLVKTFSKINKTIFGSLSVGHSESRRMTDELGSRQRDLSTSSVTKRANGHWHAIITSSCR